MSGILTGTLRNAARWGVLVLVGVCGFLPVRARATPLHRHALEHWPPENYSVLIFHHEPLTSASQGLVEILDAAARQSGANLTVRVVDVNQPMPEPVQTVWFTQTGVEPPWMVVTTPGQNDDPPVWAGTLGLESVNALLESPARRKIVEGLLDGDAAVWVLLECGDTIRDEAAVDLLAAELKVQERRFSSRSELTNAPLETAGRAVKGGFSLVRVTRADPAEQFFVTNLLHGTVLPRTKPVVFPVYGRGRVLGEFSGRRLNAESIASACAMIWGACSNLAKASNPGRDLLLAADWLGGSKRLVDASVPPGTPAKAGSTSTLARAVGLRMPASTNSPSITPATSDEPGARSAGTFGWVTTIIVVSGVLSFWFLRSRRGGPS